MTRRAPRVDGSQKAIVDLLNGHPGVTVWSLAGQAHGCPDLLVGVEGHTYLVEVKDGSLPPSRQRFTSDQREFLAWWRGSPVLVFRSERDARDWLQKTLIYQSLAQAPYPGGPHAEAG